jgi:hypothetical protein
MIINGWNNTYEYDEKTVMKSNWFHGTPNSWNKAEQYTHSKGAKIRLATPEEILYLIRNNMILGSNSYWTGAYCHTDVDMAYAYSYVLQSIIKEPKTILKDCVYVHL